MAFCYNFKVLAKKGSFLLLMFNLIVLINGNSNELSQVKGLGPHVKATTGKPWPMPQKITNFGENFMVVRTSLFRFHITNNTCDMIEQALKRYYSILIKDGIAGVKNLAGNDENQQGYRGHLDILDVNLLSPCEYLPHDKMDESYKIKIDTPSRPKKGILIANTNWGVLRGLETFSQLVHHSPTHSALRVKSTLIQDFPRFSFRSVLLDTSRHFLPKSVLFQNLDLMAMNKMNVFHWHIVDDQSFPFVSKVYPDLSAQGAYQPYTHVYTAEDVKEIIEYARLRGIRVIPEFDTPGHTLSWGPGVKDLLTPCYTNDSLGKPTPDGTFGPINPILTKNYDFLRKLFSEIASIFPDKYVHLGGDEVDFSCWESNPHITSFMRAQNISDYSALEEFYMQQLVNIVDSFPQNKSSIVWQEVVDNGVKLEKDTLINVWKGANYQEELSNVTALEHRVLLYSCWYLDQISWNIDWPRYYSCEPHNFTGSLKQHSLVVGGGAALWTEFVDSTNAISRLWPRASAPAERLWSPRNVNDVAKAAPRLEEHRCRLLRRGYSVQPINGPGFCEVELWD